jgi:hypothetical protein
MMGQVQLKPSQLYQRLLGGQTSDDDCLDQFESRVMGWLMEAPEHRQRMKETF